MSAFRILTLARQATAIAVVGTNKFFTHPPSHNKFHINFFLLLLLQVIEAYDTCLATACTNKDYVVHVHLTFLIIIIYTHTVQLHLHSIIHRILQQCRYLVDPIWSGSG